MSIILKGAAVKAQMIAILNTVTEMRLGYVSEHSPLTTAITDMSSPTTDNYNVAASDIKVGLLDDHAVYISISIDPDPVDVTVKTLLEVGLFDNLGEIVLYANDIQVTHQLGNRLNIQWIVGL